MAVRIRSEFVEAHTNRALVLRDLGRLDESITALEIALCFMPNFSEAHHNRGNVLFELGQPGHALNSFDTALRIQPSHPQALSNRGNALYSLGRLADALASYYMALCLKPDLIEASCNAIMVLLDLNMVPKAVSGVCRALTIEVSKIAKALFVICLNRPEFPDCIGARDEWLWRCLKESWARPDEMAGSTILQFKRSPIITDIAGVLASQGVWFGDQIDFALKSLASDPLLNWLMRATVIPDVGIEKLLIAARRALLQQVSAMEGEDCIFEEPILNFACTLAQACFINEYIFSCPDDEKRLVEDLKFIVISSMAGGENVPLEQIVLLGSYVPLNTLPGAERLHNLIWPEQAKDLLRVQITEPYEERLIRPQIRQLTDIRNEISARVRRQYEENPYPRWISAADLDAYPSIDLYFRAKFPQHRCRLQFPPHPAILVAGCGTGQQPIETARRFPYSKLLAVDLSLSSLAYARRKAQEAGLSNIEFAQADLLQIGGLGYRFDVIESVGVLHHLSDPLAGMAVLASLLQPSGLMKLGLYSATARRDVAAVQSHIAERRLAPTLENIRVCRQELFAFPDGDIRKSVMLFSDFYSTSGCRDLLFHVQERCFSILDISQWLKKFGLTFVGFEIDYDVKRLFGRHFPAPKAEMELNLWREFEEMYPNTFRNMYQFWVQKSD